MTNAEKYIGDEDTIDEFIDEIADYIIIDISDEFCKEDKGYIKQKLTKFFQKDVKPTLTEDERVILRNLKEYKFIGRGKNNRILSVSKRIIAGELYITKYSSKDYDFDDTEWILFEPYEHLFHWINSGEEYEIKELLK